MTLKPYEYEEIIHFIDLIDGMNPLMFGEICKKLLDYTHVESVED